MSALTDFAAKLMTGKALPTTTANPEPSRSLLPIPVLKFLNRGTELMNSLTDKIHDEQQTLAALEQQRRAIALDVDLGEADASKLTAVNAKVAKQRQKIADLQAAKDEAATRISAEAAATAAAKEVQAVKDVEALIAEWRVAANDVDDFGKKYVAARERVADIAVRLKIQGIDFGVGKRVLGRANFDLGFLTKGAIGTYLPTDNGRDMGAEKEIPPTEQLLAARQRDRSNGKAH